MYLLLASLANCSLCSSHPTPSEPAVKQIQAGVATFWSCSDFSRFADTSLFFAKHIIDSGCRTTDFEGIEGKIQISSECGNSLEPSLEVGNCRLNPRCTNGVALYL